MKHPNRLLLAVTFILLSLNSNSQKKPAKYTDYDHGYNLWYYDKWDSAFLMFNRYVNNADNTLKKGSAYKFMGEMQWYIGDLYGAQESLTGAIHTLDPLNKKHHEELGYVYNILGNISQDLKLYHEAINFYDNAMNFVRGTDFMYEVMNGKATALRKNGNYNDAIAIYDSIVATQSTDQSRIARIIDNRANTRWLQNAGYSALPEFWAALKIRIDSQYNQGLNASYAHIADYYAKTKPDSAVWYANKMFAKANEIHNAKDILEAIDKLVSFNSSPVLKEYWYQEFKILNDSLQLAKDNHRNRFALIRYDVQKSKSDNLVLQQHITRQRVLMYGLIGVAVVIITWLSTWYRKRRKRIKQESENAIREAKLKTSQKVHDVVANGLYTIMNELEHSKTLDKEPLITRIEGLYEKSRNISYEEILPDSNVEYDNQIHDLLNGYSNDQTDVFVVGNQQTFWNKITGTQKNELLLILNEIMVNMKKHSGANSVVIRFTQENNKGFIHYNDNGRGFPPGFEFGNGLKNTVSRIKSLNGEVIFGKSEKGGASITISFPLESDKL